VEKPLTGCLVSAPVGLSFSIPGRDADDYKVSPYPLLLPQILGHTESLVFAMPPQKPDIEATEPAVSSSSSGKSELGTTRHTENAHAPRQKSVAAKLRNPLVGQTEEQILADVETWCTEKGLSADLDSFRKGALIARVGQRDDGFEYVKELSEEEKEWLRHEMSHRWSQPKMLYFLVVLCAGSAIVQGMDQTAVNGAQVCLIFSLFLNAR